MMMRVFEGAGMNAPELAALCERPKMSVYEAEAAVRPILDAVRAKGDEAILHYNRRFSVFQDQKDVFIPLSALAEPILRADVKEALDTAMRNVRSFHEAQLRQRLTVETMPGVTCFREFRPLDAVGLYVPGGTAVLPSTAIMLAVPAMIAGCKTILLATPLRDDGTLLPEIVYIAKKCGVTGIVAAGGAQAIAAMAYGTGTVPKVHKILGPGNQYVTAAKTILAASDAGIAIDMPAGPSEVLVIADGSANPAFIAADLLSQAEHGSDSQVVLVLTDRNLLPKVMAQLQLQLNELPRRDIAQQALKNGYVLHVENEAAAIAFSNLYAPEHLILHLQDAEQYVEKITNAGSVFLGMWSPESVGDYASGTNHTLPTYGYARQYGGVSTETFGKYITFQQLSKEGLQLLGPTVETLASLEGLEAHKRAVSIRLEELKNA
jgi:histidinol dehydrogenase